MNYMEMKKMNKYYYVEFENCHSDKPFSVCSRYFKNKEEAIMWYINSFDFVDTDDTFVSLHMAIFDDYYNLDYTEFIEDITTKFYLKGDF